MSGTGDSRRAILAAFIANLGIAVAKFVGFAFTGSASLLAEGVHSLADTGNQALLFLGGRRARRPATPHHPFGFGRERYFWAFMVSVVLFTLGAAFAIGEGIDKILHPHEIESVAWGAAILVIAVILEANSFRTALQEANESRGDMSLWRYIRRSRAPEIPVVLLEDFAALVGLGFALVALALSEITGDAVWDGYGTLCIGLLLGLVAAVLAVEMKSLLIGESAVPAAEQAIQRAIEAHPKTQRLIHLRTEHLGPDELLVGAKIEFSSDLSFAELASTIDEVEADVRAAVPEARVMYLEPDCYRSARSNAP